MKTVLVTTTINVPHVLKLYRHTADFIVVGDEKTPHDACRDLLKSLGKGRYYSPEEQRDLGYACSDLIGWNCVQRRNIGFLEALKAGAEAIVTWDDDNLPMVNPDDPAYALRFAFDGIAVSGFNNWFDPGCLLSPVSRHRGFPHDSPSLWRAGAVIGAKVGVAAGMCLGDPDIAATTRMERLPAPVDVHSVSELARNGVVVDRNTWTVFNSQNTTFLRELTPAMFMLPGVGRYDDIIASLICQRVMREREMHVHLGRPFVWQQRNAHNLLSDLRLEIRGMEHIREIAEILESTSLPGESVLADARVLYEALSYYPWLAKPCEAALVWCDDVERVL